MSLIESSDELMEHISKIDRDHSVFQFSIPGKGKFMPVLQEEAEQSIEADVKKPQLKQMIRESLTEYKEGKGMTTSQLFESLA